MKLSNPLEAVRRDKTMAPCTSVHSTVWTQVTRMEPNSKDPKDNDQEAEVALPISISPRRLIQLAAPRMTSVNGLGTSIMRDWPPSRVREALVYASSLHSGLSMVKVKN